MNLAYTLDFDTTNALCVDLKDYMIQKKLVTIHDKTILDEDVDNFSWVIFGNECKEIISEDWLGEFHEKIKIFNIAWLYLTYRRETYDYEKTSLIHLDYNTRSNRYFYYGLNFVVDRSDSEMVWYERNGLDFDVNARDTYFWVDRKYAKEIYRATIPHDKLTLVNTSVLHDIDSKNKERWAVSFRGGLNAEFNSWEESVNFFSPWIINN